MVSEVSLRGFLVSIHCPSEEYLTVTINSVLWNLGLDTSPAVGLWGIIHDVFRLIFKRKI